MNGTTIQDLQKGIKMDQYGDARQLQNMQNIQYGAMHNLQHELGHNSAHQNQQGQHDAYYNIDNNMGYPRWLPKENNMEEIVKDITDNLPEDSAIPNVSEDIEKFNLDEEGLMSSIPKILREPLIIFVLFVILSQPFIKDTISKYIPQVNPDMTGKFGLTSVIIYGVILSTLFIVVKKFLM